MRSPHVGTGAAQGLAASACEQKGGEKILGPGPPPGAEVGCEPQVLRAGRKGCPRAQPQSSSGWDVSAHRRARSGRVGLLLQVGSSPGGVVGKHRPGHLGRGVADPSASGRPRQHWGSGCEWSLMSREGSGGGRAGRLLRVCPSSRKGNNGRRLLSHYSVLVLSATHTVLHGAWLGQWQCRRFNLGSTLEQAGQGTAGEEAESPRGGHSSDSGHR